MKDGIVLFYCKDSVLYPVALTEEQQYTLDFTASLLSPLTVVFDKPQGSAVNLLGKSKTGGGRNGG
ncbi:hypothetical protein [Paenibacillus agricola]|uniref:Uncharacterized protein n=1 Tax=Paenibacillus agricola TaxID=2716264 RepID=A0ABX0JE29_9BACL|nr:hypothetical protein [Paenibacillus agricola]NHN33514.1 hypothetical protein [Paenibacillus agricola]